MKNHYVSQFIIKRFANAMNIFDVKSGKIYENKQPQKIFYKYDIFDKEIEELTRDNIESRVANILDNKILNQGNITLTRDELETLKRYMLICSVRTQDEDFFCNILLNFEKNADKYIGIWSKYSNLPKTKELNLSNHELYLRTLKVFANTKNIKDIAEDSLATREMLAWAFPFLESYIAFWDCPEDKEFILTDCGMCSEYEGFHIITEGIDISKMSYLIHKINNKKIEYSGVFASNFIMYENYSIYNLNSTRCMVMINPFFRLYHNAQVNIGDKIYYLDKPDIWPAIIQNRELFGIPDNKYVYYPPFYNPNDLFIYKPKKLTNEDLIYINNLILMQTKEIIGFNNATKIIDSIYYYIWHSSNFNSVKYLEQPLHEVISNLAKNVATSPFRELCSFCESKGGVNKTAYVDLFEKLLGNIFKDFHENPYLIQHLLNNTEETINCKNLDFLGKGTKKLDVLRDILSKIQEKNKNETI